MPKKKLAMNGSFTTKVADCLIDHLSGTTVRDVVHYTDRGTLRLVDYDTSAVYEVTITKEKKI